MASFTDLVIGLVCTAVAVWSAHASYTLRRDGVVAEGVVVGEQHEVEIRSDGWSFSHAPIVQFRPAAGGTPVTFRSGVWSTFGGHDKGDKVKVRYLPARPDDARIDSLLNDVLVPFVLGFLAFGAFAGKLHADRSWTLFSKRWED